MEPTSLASARSGVMDLRWSKLGVDCPCCNQLAKVYHRTINATMARWMIALYHKSQADPRWYRIREPWSLKILGGTGDAAKLSYWKLIEEGLNDDPDKRKSGLWRLTPTGLAWVRGECSVEKVAHVYNAEVVGFEGGPWTVVDALGKKFSYPDLMNNEEAP